jgi:hypothetical protein
MQNDPWAWTNQPASTPLGASARAQQPEMGPAPAPQQGPLGMATQIAAARGINMGVDKAIDPKAYKSVGDYFGIGGNVDVVANANASGVDPMQSMLDANNGFNTYAGTAEASMPTMTVAPTATVSAPLSAAAAETGVAAAAETGATIAATDLAATTAATTAAAGAGTAAAATAGTTAATGAAVAGGTAAAAGTGAAVAGTAAAAGAGTAAAAAPLAAMGPVGWAVLAGLAAKKFGYI